MERANLFCGGKGEGRGKSLFKGLNAQNPNTKLNMKMSNIAVLRQHVNKPGKLDWRGKNFGGGGFSRDQMCEEVQSKLQTL